MDEKERNYCCLVLLLNRVGLQKLRGFFIYQWDTAGGFVQWTDCPQNGTDLLTKYTPLSYERPKVQSGDSHKWDLSLFVKVLINSRPPFVPKSNKVLVAGLKCLKETRNELCHTGNGRIESTEFDDLYKDACSALKLLGASRSDFKKVEEDVQKPWSEVLSLVKHCASQDTDILQGICTINDRLDKLQKGVDKLLQNQIQSQKTQEEIQRGVADLEQGQEDLKQGQSGLQKGQEDLQEGQSGLQQGLEELKLNQQQGQSGLQQGQEKILKGIENLQKSSTKSSGLSSEELKQTFHRQKPSTADLPSQGWLAWFKSLFHRKIQGRTSISADVESYSINLKEAIAQKTQFLPRGIDNLNSRLKTDDIFTNLTVYQGKQKSLQKSKKRKAQEENRARKAVTKISEIFVDKNEGNPKSILLSGEAGIGKTLFSYKILRDWSANCISIPKIQFAYLITFRQLVLLGEKELTLRELLNRSPLLNTRTMIDEKVMQHAIHHSEQLLLVLDGFDEYKQYDKILGVFESPFPNDVNTKMPVPALISKIVQKKVLSDSVTVITSRPGEANKMDEKLQFDRCVEITGFSEKQIIQFVEKYFNSKPEEEKKMAVERVKGTAHYMSFGRVPLMCWFVCRVIEWEIQNKLKKNNLIPLTLTQFYCEIISSLERCNREIDSLDEEAASSAVEKTLDNFTKLAASLAVDQYSFTHKELEKLKLPEKEISYLKRSCLIICYPIASDSPIPQTTLEYGFAHLTIQEFFVARHLVKTNAMAAQEASEMVLRFTSGLLGLDKQNNNDELMSRVVECVCKQEKNEWRRRLVLLRCLYEYGQEKEFTRQQLSTNPDNRYWDRDGVIVLYRDVTDTDCDAIAMLVNTATSMASPPHRLYIGDSLLTRTGLNTLLPSLVRPKCTITKLLLRWCRLDDEAAECLAQHLPNSKITYLNLAGNKITDTGSQHIVRHLPSKITDLNLYGNPVSDECEESVKQFCKANYPGLELDI